ncbi:MAG: HAMP domain-containing histidine kinase [Acidobacteria bacterium]|nr:HAMP domain-containing histidine kinase [Acidobacteriota bacterium]
MTSPVDDPNWPRLLALAVHEFRTPMTVVAGYIRMLLKDRAGPLTDQQRRLLEEAEKSCVRLSGLLGEMSELSSLEAGTATFNRSEVDLRAVLHDAVATLPAVPERDVSVELSSGTGRAIVHGDPVRLKSALTAVLVALRRELVTSNRLFVRDHIADYNGRPAVWIACADADNIDEIERTDPASLITFDEWRGGCGLTLANARRTFESHGGRVWSAGKNQKAGAVLVLPAA